MYRNWQVKCCGIPPGLQLVDRKFRIPCLHALILIWWIMQWKGARGTLVLYPPNGNFLSTACKDTPMGYNQRA